MKGNRASERKLKVAVTGAGGQLGQELMLYPSRRFEMIGLDRQALDITDSDECLRTISELAPDVIIHAAAYTAVDKAEEDRRTAWRVNVEGTRHVARAAEQAGAKLCYIGTDYVFDGKSDRPYEINDPTKPLTFYGKTKLEGEYAAKANCSKTFIVRTSWVYGLYGQNFVRTMLQLASKRKVLTVVDDQRGSPTYTFDLARFIADLVVTDRYGTYHATNAGVCTWYEFASAIMKKANATYTEVTPCTTEQFPRPAPRPAYSALSNRSLVDAGFEPFRHWEEALDDFLHAYLIDNRSRQSDAGF